MPDSDAPAPDAPQVIILPPTPKEPASIARAETVRAGWRLWGGTLLVLGLALGILIPSVGDFGLTWDEPAYRYSQLVAVQWWEQLAQVRSLADLRPLLDPDALLYYWPYGRYGINFHPPLGGQLNLAAHALFGWFMQDIPARRMASVIEFALTVTLLYHFLAGRYGVPVALTAGGSVLLMPRLYGQAHLIDTDIPGLLIWTLATIAFWKGQYEPGARRWRVLVGVLVGLAFVEKPGALMVLGPILVWLCLSRLPRGLLGPGAGSNITDAALTLLGQGIPLLLAFLQIQLLQQKLPPPDLADLFLDRPPAILPGAILAAPVLVWMLRRFVGRLRPKHKIWGVERPGLETFSAILAFGALIAWLGNPAWWLETMPRLAHYYTLTTDRHHALPTIQVLYLGQIYEYALPWHNAWVLLAVTVPVTTLGVAAIGFVDRFFRSGSDRLPLYFFVHFLTLPVVRMFPTPGHDGVRLFLPTFLFLSVFAGWGAVAAADLAARAFRLPHARARVAAVALALIGPTLSLGAIHPYELSYYNTLVQGPRGAWHRGFELTYWYDAFTPAVLDDLNARFPRGAEVDFLNPKTNPVTFQELQTLGHLRSDLLLVRRSRARFPYVWLLTQDSKASAFTRLLFAMTPWYASRPEQLAGARVLTVADPIAVARAWALSRLLDAGDHDPPDPPNAPAWVRNDAPWLARFWGDGLETIPRLKLNQSALTWSRDDPAGMLAAARALVAARLRRSTNAPESLDPGARRLLRIMTADLTPAAVKFRQELVDQVLEARPEAFIEAVEILNAHRQEVAAIMTRPGYTDVEAGAGFLDRDLAQDASTARESTADSASTSAEGRSGRNASTSARASAPQDAQ